MNVSTNYQVNNNINFKSRINLVDTNTFWQVMSRTSRAVKKVDYPWLPDQIIKSPLVWTEDVRTCTAGGIVTKNIDGSRDVVMFHLNPTNKINKNYKEIAAKFIEIIGNSTPIQALMIGSKDNDVELRYSGEYFDEIACILNRLKIPITKLRGIPMGGYEANILYDGSKDTWTVLNTKRDDLPPRTPERNGFTGFKETVLSALDCIVYD